jgi:hypothetical protein
MTTERKIAWEKFTPISEINPINHIDQNDIPDNEEEEAVDEEDEGSNENLVGRLINFEDLLINDKVRTPFGFYSTEDDFSPYNMFECWVGHTNFKLTRKDFDILNNDINGIGCLKVLSPYRFFIGIEKMFSFAAVRIQIQKDLCKNLNMEETFIDGNDDVDNVINTVISRINDAFFNIKDSERWAVFVSNEGGNIQSIKNSECGSDLEYQKKLANLKSLKNGNIIIYDSL